MNETLSVRAFVVYDELVVLKARGASVTVLSGKRVHVMGVVHEFEDLCCAHSQFVDDVSDGFYAGYEEFAAITATSIQPQ